MSGSHHHSSGWNFPGDDNPMHSSGSDFVSEFFGSLTPDFSAPPAAAAAAANATDFPVGGGMEEEKEEVESSVFGREHRNIGASTSAAKRTREDDENNAARPPTRKRNRSTEMHNMAERRRRDKIKEKLKALQELIPNSQRLDNVALLDEAISYVKALQLQIQIMQSSGMYHSSCVSPGAMHCLHMPHFSSFSHMGLGYGMGMTSMSRPVLSPLMSMPSPMGAANMVPMPGFSTVPTYCPLSQSMPFASLPDFSMPGMMPLSSPPVLRSGPFSSHRGEPSTQEEAQNQEQNASEPISTTC